MVPAEVGCSILLGGGFVARALFPGAGAKLGHLGVDCCHLVGEVLDMLLKSIAGGEWHNAHEY
jgi:hypothetical protein